MLSLREEKLIDIIKSTGMVITPAQMSTYLKKEEEEGFVEAPVEVLSHFLNGMIYFKRGKDENRPLIIEKHITNNTVLKKLRVAFELKDEDILKILTDAGFQITLTEISSFFRKEDHRNFRPCGDQFLRNFLKGLTEKLKTKS